MGINGEQGIYMHTERIQHVLDRFTQQYKTQKREQAVALRRWETRH